MTPTPAVPVHMRRNLFDPVEELMKLQDDAPVSLVELPFNAWSVPAWLVTGYHDIREVLGNAARFSSSSERMRDFLVANVGEAMEPQRPSATAGSFIEADPPEHTRLRRLLIPEFTVRRMRRLRPRIEAIVSEHLDAMQSHGGPVDLVQALALPVPSLVICELLGVPYADRLDFQRHTSVMLDAESSPDEQEAANDSARAYMTELVRSQRADPGEDLLGMLIREHGSDLSEEELVGIGVLLLIAGHETTANMLGLGTLALLSHPDQWALLRSDTERVDRAVEELMRYLTVVHTPVLRIVTEDTTIGGQPVRAGEAVVCSLSSANRDKALMDGAHVLDITREPSRHVAFGHGVHHCLGAPLARMEMQIAFPALVQRFPALRLAVPLEDVPLRATSFIYGVKALPVTW